MIFILKNLKLKIIIIIFNEAFNIVRKLKLLIITINDFVLFYYFKIFKIKRIVRKRENIKT